MKVAGATILYVAHIVIASAYEPEYSAAFFFYLAVVLIGSAIVKMGADPVFVVFGAAPIPEQGAGLRKVILLVLMSSIATVMFAVVTGHSDSYFESVTAEPTVSAINALSLIVALIGAALTSFSASFLAGNGSVLLSVVIQNLIVPLTLCLYAILNIGVAEPNLIAGYSYILLVTGGVSFSAAIWSWVSERDPDIKSLEGSSRSPLRVRSVIFLWPAAILAAIIGNAPMMMGKLLALSSTEFVQLSLAHRTAMLACFFSPLVATFFSKKFIEAGHDKGLTQTFLKQSTALSIRLNLPVAMLLGLIASSLLFIEGQQGFAQATLILLAGQLANVFTGAASSLLLLKNFFVEYLGAAAIATSAGVLGATLLLGFTAPVGVQSVATVCALSVALFHVITSLQCRQRLR